FLFFSAIHFLFFRAVFSALSAKAFAKPASFITPMTNGWVLRINTDARSGVSAHGGSLAAALASAGCRNAVLCCDLRHRSARAVLASRLAARAQSRACLVEPRLFDRRRLRCAVAVRRSGHSGGALRNLDGAAVRRRRHDTERSAFVPRPTDTLAGHGVR